MKRARPCATESFLRSGREEGQSEMLDAGAEVKGSTARHGAQYTAQRGGMCWLCFFLCLRVRGWATCHARSEGRGRASEKYNIYCRNCT